MQTFKLLNLAKIKILSYENTSLRLTGTDIGRLCNELSE